MRNSIRLFIPLVLIAQFTSCVAPLIIRQSRKSDTTAVGENNLGSLSMGDCKEKVIGLLGPPLKEEEYELKHGETVEFLLYPSVDEAGKVDKKNLVPLAFRDNRLYSHSVSYYKGIKEHNIKL